MNYPPGPPPSEIATSEEDSSNGFIPPLLFASGAGGGGLALAASNSGGATSSDSGSSNDNGGNDNPNNDDNGPTAIITLNRTTLNAGDVATVTITFSEAVDNLTLADFTAENGVLSALNTVDNITWTATFTPTALIPFVANNEINLDTNYTDLNGNQGSAAMSPTYDIDTTTANVVFDLSTGRGVSSDSGGRMFQAGVQYDIYIVVDSANLALTFDPAQRWAQAGNLGADDTLTLVGTGSPVRFDILNPTNAIVGSFAVSTASVGYAWVTNPPLTGAAVAVAQVGGVLRQTAGLLTSTTAIWSSIAPASFILVAGPVSTNPPNLFFLSSLPGTVTPPP